MITLVQLNCRGYWNNRHLISEAIRSIDPDIVLLNHTGLPLKPIKLYGYNTRYTTGTLHDGVAIMVKNTLRHTHITDWPSAHFLATKIHTQHGPLLVATTYCRPNTGLPLTSLNTLFNHTNIPVYILADLNAKHTAFRHNNSNRHGQELLQLTQLKRLRFLGPDFPTCFTHNGTGRPDLILSNRQTLPFHHHISHGPLCGSDHLPVILKISSNPISIPSSPTPDYHLTNWDDFKNTLTNMHRPLHLDGKDYTEIDNALERLQNDILTAADRHTPKRQHKIHIDFRPSIRTQRLLTCYRTRFLTNMNNHLPIFRDLHILRRHIINSLQDDHNAHWKSLVSRLHGTRCRNPTQFWRMIHRLRGCQRESFDYLAVDGVRITDPAQVTDVFRQHWTDTFQTHPLPQHEPSVTHINYITEHIQQNHEDVTPHNNIQLTRLDPHQYLISPIEEEDVSRLLRHTPRRAPGPSGINWHMVRNLPPETICNLTKIFNALLASGYFPKFFKKSNITLIPKPGKDPHLPESYRPISLLEVLGKTFERAINQRLRAHLDSEELLSPQQFGFRSGASTEDALNSIIAYLNSNKLYTKTALVTKDVKKAFDTVWHIGLKYKIRTNFNLPPLIQKLLCNFLDDRQARIRHQGTLSAPFAPQAGVPQGSVLSPTLYNMYTADLPSPLHNDSLTIQYADDVTQLARARMLDHLTDKIQRELTRTSLWELQWRIISNPEKSKVTYFNKKSAAPRQISLYPNFPNPVPIPISNTNKVLGLTIDKHLRFNIHINQKAAIASRALSNLERFRDSNTKTKLHLYKAFILPLLTYCPLALSLSAPTNLLKLQRIQNRAIRFALGTKWFDFRTSLSTHEEANIPPINITLHNRTQKQLTLFHVKHPHTYNLINNLPRPYRHLPHTNLLDPPDEPPDPVFR